MFCSLPSVHWIHLCSISKQTKTKQSDSLYLNCWIFPGLLSRTRSFIIIQNVRTISVVTPEENAVFSFPLPLIGWNTCSACSSLCSSRLMKVRSQPAGRCLSSGQAEVKTVFNLNVWTYPICLPEVVKLGSFCQRTLAGGTMARPNNGGTFQPTRLIKLALSPQALFPFPHCLCSDRTHSAIRTSAALQVSFSSSN